MNKTKKQSKPRNKKPSRALISIPWLWLLFGITIGILIYSFLFDNNKATNTAKKKKSEIEKKLHSYKNKKNYDFYNLLTKSDKKRAKAGKPKTLALKSKKSTSGRYIIQAGSFQKLADAKQLKAKLALSGFSSRIKSVRVKNKTWYRIQMGPYSNKSTARQKQAKLRKHAVSGSMLVRLH